MSLLLLFPKNHLKNRYTSFSSFSQQMKDFPKAWLFYCKKLFTNLIYSQGQKLRGLSLINFYFQKSTLIQQGVGGEGGHIGQFYPKRRNNAKCYKPQENCEINFNWCSNVCKDMRFGKTQKSHDFYFILDAAHSITSHYINHFHQH